MSRTELIDLDQHLGEFVDSQVAQGRYRSAAEVFQAGLRLLEDEAKVEALRAALIEGEESGDCEEFDFDAFLARKRVSG